MPFNLNRRTYKGSAIAILIAIASFTFSVHSAFAFTIASQLSNDFGESFDNVTAAGYSDITVNLGTGLTGTVKSFTIFGYSGAGSPTVYVQFFECGSNPYTGDATTTATNIFVGGAGVCTGVYTKQVAIGAVSGGSASIATSTGITLSGSKWYVLDIQRAFTAVTIFGGAINNTDLYVTGAGGFTALDHLNSPIIPYYLISSDFAPQVTVVSQLLQQYPGIDFSTSTAANFNCDTFDIGCYLKEGAAWAFLPTTEAKLRFRSITIASSSPFGYIYDVPTVYTTMMSASGSPITMSFDFGNLYSALDSMVPGHHTSVTRAATTSVMFLNSCAATNFPGDPYGTYVMPFFVAALWFGFLWELYALAHRIF